MIRDMLWDFHEVLSSGTFPVFAIFLLKLSIKSDFVTNIPDYNSKHTST